MSYCRNFLASACIALVAGLLVNANAPSTTAQEVISPACGCGVPKCTGCLKGKLFPIAKKAKTQHQHKKGCGCTSCTTAQVVGKEQVVSDVLISQEYLPESSSCGCGQATGCQSCRTRKLRRKTCPQCDCDFCELKVSKTNEKKKCFEVKQKEICIPPVRLPWQKCCPPNKAKVRVVNVLKSKTYECPSCKYEWKVFEPETPGKSADTSDAVKVKMSDSPNAGSVPLDAAAPVPSTAPRMMPKLQDPKNVDLNSVPRPPVERN